LAVLLIAEQKQKMATAGPSAPPPQPSGAQPSGGQPSKRLQQTQAQVDEVVDIMRVNVEKVLERDQKLTDLDSRADALQDGARQFENTATRLKRKYWWQNCKMWLILIVVIIVIIIIIIVAVVTSLPKSDSSGGTATTVKPAGG
jgi:vesicle-associated membrane protein 3